LSFANTSDIGYYFSEDQNGTTPWEDPEAIWEHSPIKYADKVKTPTLFLHSDEDTRCWMVEGIQMFYALKNFHVPARLVLFHQETHELSRSGRPKSRIRRNEEIVKWMKKYL
jgi:dipeptidyl aminopeptidase/acylaminoacyl peptidase